MPNIENIIKYYAGDEYCPNGDPLPRDVAAALIRANEIVEAQREVIAGLEQVNDMLNGLLNMYSRKDQK